jgi:glucosylceramidase
MKYKKLKNRDNFKNRWLLINVLWISLLMFTSQCKKIENPQISVYVSSQDGDRLTQKADGQFTEDKESSLPVINIDENIRFQKIDGFGASFNEAGMICLNALDPEKKEEVLKRLFSTESGAGFSAMKSPLGACDFASAGSWYTYNDIPNDTLMKNFSIERDLAPNGLIPFIKAASKYGKFEIESPMDFAPDWMYFSLKKGERNIKPKYYNALARYYTKYIQAYAANGVTINYLNLFNESGVYSDVPYKVIGELIKNHVGPLFQSEGINTKIQLGETPNSAQTLEYYPPLLEDKDIRKYIHSLTFHGYSWGTSDNLTLLHNKYPEIPIWQTEVCYAVVNGPTMVWNNLPPEVSLKMPIYEFSDGEFWGNQIINDMKNWVSAWIYWNMILDQEGGPCLVAPEHDNPPGNRQHPVVIINRNSKEVSYTGLYYYLTHFSKFIRPGAYRIYSNGGPENLNFAAFLNTDGSIILNIINNGGETDCKVLWKKKISIQRLKAHSITTLKWLKAIEK